MFKLAQTAINAMARENPMFRGRGFVPKLGEQATLAGFLAN